MSVQAISTDNQPIAPLNEQKQPKKRRIPRRIAEVVRLLVTGECKTQRAAAERTGMSETYLSTALSKPEILAHIEQQTRVSLARLQAPAAATLARLMTEAASEHVQKDIAIHALAINGHKPKADAQVSVNIDIKAGYVIDLTDNPKPGNDARLTQGNHITIENDEISR
jgi:hypothetical protein